MTRLQLVEKILKVLNMNESHKREIETAATAAVQRFGESTPEMVGRVVEGTGLEHKAVSDTEKMAFASLMTSDLTDQDMEQYLAFLEGDLGQRWQKARIEIHKSVTPIIYGHATIVGQNFLRMLYDNLVELLIQSVHELRPDLPYEHVSTWVRKTISEHQI